MTYLVFLEKCLLFIRRRGVAAWEVKPDKPRLRRGAGKICVKKTQVPPVEASFENHCQNQYRRKFRVGRSGPLKCQAKRDMRIVALRYRHRRMREVPRVVTPHNDGARWSLLSTSTGGLTAQLSNMDITPPRGTFFNIFFFSVK